MRKKREKVSFITLRRKEGSQPGFRGRTAGTAGTG
jgi:hypothetical protein